IRAMSRSACMTSRWHSIPICRTCGTAGRSFTACAGSNRNEGMTYTSGLILPISIALLGGKYQYKHCIVIFPPRRCKERFRPPRRGSKPRPPPAGVSHFWTDALSAGRTWACRFCALETHRLCLDHIGQMAHRLDQIRGQLLIDLDQRNRVTARGGAAEMKGRNIDRGGPQRVAERADEPRLVIITNKQHVMAELGLERDALDFDEARLV